MSVADFYEMKAKETADETSRPLVYAILSAGFRIAEALEPKIEYKEVEPSEGPAEEESLMIVMNFADEAKEFIETAMHEFYTDDPKIVIMQALGLLGLQRAEGKFLSPTAKIQYPYGPDKK